MNLATVERIDSVIPHPNADRLDIATVAGYECIVAKDSYKEGDICVFIQPDSVLPEEGSPEEFGTYFPWVTPYLTYVSSRTRRVKAIKLREIWSMGLVVPVNPQAHRQTSIVNIGDDMTAQLGITKYEAPLPKDVQARGGLPFNIPKTDETNWQGLHRTLPSLLGERVDVTLKIDGASFTIYCKLTEEGPVSGVCSRTLDLKDGVEFTNIFLEAERKYDVRRKLEAYCLENGVSLALRGEVYGTGVRKDAKDLYSKVSRGVKFFSCLDIDSLQYYPPGSEYYYEKVATELELPVVDMLERNVPLTMTLIHKYGSETNEIGGHPFEGVVIKGAFGSFKVINKPYDSRRG